MPLTGGAWPIRTNSSRLILALQQSVDSPFRSGSAPAEQGGGVRLEGVAARARGARRQRPPARRRRAAGDPHRRPGRIASTTGRSTAWTSRRPSSRRCRRTRASSIARRGIADASFRIGGLGPVPHQPPSRARPRRRGRPDAAGRGCRGSRRWACRRASSCWRSLPRGLVDHRRRHRLGQDHDARGARRRDQPPRRPAHRHHRGSGRIRARPSRQHHRAGRDRRRRAGLPDRAPRRAAAGAGRDRHRRDARSGDDADRARGGGDRTSRALDAAHHRRRVHRRRALPTRFRSSGRTRSGRSWRWRWPRSPRRCCCRASAAA